MDRPGSRGCGVAPFHCGDWDTSGRCRAVTPTSRTSTSCARRWLSSAAATCKKLLLSEEGKRVIIIAGTLHLEANSRDKYLAAVADVALKLAARPDVWTSCRRLIRSTLSGSTSTNGGPPMVTFSGFEA